MSVNLIPASELYLHKKTGTLVWLNDGFTSPKQWCDYAQCWVKFRCPISELTQISNLECEV